MSSDFQYRPWASRLLQGASLANWQVWIASSDMQGWRASMEDGQRIILNWKTHDGQKLDAYVGLFDGHLGFKAASYALHNLPEILQSQEAFHQPDYPTALRMAFMEIDERICRNRGIASGCTALVTLLVGTMVYIAHVGDSRAVICSSGNASDLTEAHILDRPGELERIEKAGGFVRGRRVCGRLAMTRSLGDAHFKRNRNLTPEEQIVTAFPDIITHEVQTEDEFLVLASDGIWDCFSSQEVVDIIRYQVSIGASLTQACAFLCNICLAPFFSQAGRGTDNMTIVVIAFLNGRSEREWMDWVAKRVRTGVGRTTPSTIPQIYGDDNPLKHPSLATDFKFRLFPIDSDSESESAIQ